MLCVCTCVHVWQGDTVNVCHLCRFVEPHLLQDTELFCHHWDPSGNACGLTPSQILTPAPRLFLELTHHRRRASRPPAPCLQLRENDRPSPSCRISRMPNTRNHRVCFPLNLGLLTEGHLHWVPCWGCREEICHEHPCTQFSLF